MCGIVCTWAPFKVLTRCDNLNGCFNFPRAGARAGRCQPEFSPARWQLLCTHDSDSETGPGAGPGPGAGTAC